MKKIFFLGLSFSLFAAQANADDFYLSLSGVVGKNRDKITNSKKSGRISITSEGGELGVGTYLTPDFRGELSLGYLVGKKNYTDKEYGIVEHLKLKHESYSILLNSYYDFNNHTMAVPYIMAGLGYVNNKINAKYSEYIFANTLIDQDKNSGSKKSFAWQLGAGIDMKAANDIKIGLGYRFRDTGSSSFRLKENAITVKREPYHLLLANVKMDF
ncbi:porin family protein [Holosporaceae bacterium 'Namur']|nr:porin family protein [Holosporaceae bacterium 'Namur']